MPVDQDKLSLLDADQNCVGRWSHNVTKIRTAQMQGVFPLCQVLKCGYLR